MVCVLGDGMVVDLEHLSREIREIEKKGIRVTPDHLKLSKRATISMPWHKVQDELEENRLAKTGSAFGSTAVESPTPTVTSTVRKPFVLGICFI